MLWTDEVTTPQFVCRWIYIWKFDTQGQKSRDEVLLDRLQRNGTVFYAIEVGIKHHETATVPTWPHHEGLVQSTANTMQQPCGKIAHY
jgi:hypothetical protein